MQLTLTTFPLIACVCLTEMWLDLTWNGRPYTNKGSKAELL